MFSTIYSLLKISIFLTLTILTVIFNGILPAVAQTAPHNATIFPVSFWDRHGCFHRNLNPISHTVFTVPANASETPIALATFTGGKPVGSIGRSCEGLYGYATIKTPEITFNLSNRITVNFPTPRDFANIFIEGERGKVLTVTLNGTTTLQIVLEPNYQSEPGNYGKYSLGKGEFPPNTTSQISTITIESADPYWKFAVYSVSAFTTTVGNPTDPPGNPTNPVIFVPGIAGSGLSLADTGERRWLPSLNLCKLYDLALHDGSHQVCGSYSPQNIRVDGAIKSQPIGVFPFQYQYEIYGGLLNHLDNTGGYKEYDFANNPYYRTFAGCQERHDSYPSELPTPTLFVFGYDWRRSNFENINALKQYVQCARLFHPDKKVTIIAHSMGGLLSRNYVLQNSPSHHIDKLITIGSPFLGTPKGLNVLETGSFLDAPFFARPVSHTVAGILKDLVEFYPGAHELLSSQTYFSGLAPNTPVGIKRPWTSIRPLSYSSTKTWIDDKHPVSRPASRGELFHNYLNTQRQSQDVWQNDRTDADYFHIYGQQNNNKTIGEVVIEEYALCRTLETQCNSFTRYRPYPTWGDGTVTLESAKRIFNGGKDYNYKPQDNSQPYRFAEQIPVGGNDNDADHNGMAKNPKVLNPLVKILQPDFAFDENQMTPGDCGNGTEPLSCNSSNPVKNEIGGGQNTPSHYVSLHNIGDFSIMDQSSNLTGLVGFSSENGVEKIPIGDNSAWLAMPDNGSTRTVTFRTIGTLMEIEIIRGVDYDNIEKLTVFKDLDLPADKKVELNINAGGSLSLFYYANRDKEPPIGIFPTLAVEGDNAQDINSPVLFYNYQTSATEKTVTFSATDDLSGVRQIRYSLDGQNFSTYTRPITVSLSQSNIYVFAEDNNRNRTGIAEFDLSGNSYSIGNRIWFDTNDDGKINFDDGFGEEGIGSVSLSLFADNNSDGQPDDLNNPLSSTDTDTQGYYRFENLSAGNYLVRVNPINFADNGILRGYRNTTEANASNADSDDTSNGENGIEPIGATNLIQTNGILSNIISIVGGVNQPTGETDVAFEDDGKADGLSNLTIDFGFYRLGISGTVWSDTGNGANNNNGIFDSDENGVSNMRVRLFYANGTEVPVGADGILGTSDDANGAEGNANSGGIITDLTGNYTFKGLMTNNYSIKIFRAGISSSAVFSNNPNNNEDSDNNGTNGTGTDSAFILSSDFAAVTADYGQQGNSTVNNDIAETQNPTVDFGLFFAPSATMVSVGGKVLSATGQSINRAVVTLTDNSGNVRQTFTNAFGFYNFEELEAGETYIISVSHKQYAFNPNSQIISLSENADNINFNTLP